MRSEEETSARVDLATTRIVTAGWSIPKEHASSFPETGSHLERFGTVLNAVEINTSFYRPHRPTTYERWAASVPEDFRFAVKIPKSITHKRRLEDAGDLLDRFLSEVAGLGSKLGPLLLQLPPSLRFRPGIADRALNDLRHKVDGGIVCEPRHTTWFTPEVASLLEELRIARVAADPAPVPGADEPGGWRGLSYYRLHGSPKIYYSAYGLEYLDTVAGGSRAIWRPPSKLGASSTTPPPSLRRAMRSRSAACCGSMPEKASYLRPPIPQGRLGLTH